MSGPDLREELERIAATAPVAHVPADTFARGRRARRRELVLAVGVAAVVIALVAGGAVAWLPRGGDRVQPADGNDSLGVPDHLYAVPSQALRDTRETDLAIGIGAAAWLTDTGLPVVVDAAAGRYHLLELPDGPSAFDTSGVFDGPRAVALSPDGTRLAYWWLRLGDGPRQDTGLRVVDLVSGAVTTTDLTDGAGVQVGSIVWSPDSTRLLWEGQAWDSWTRSTQIGGQLVAGQVVVGSTASTPVSVPRDSNHSMAVADDGTVAVLTSSRLRIVPPGAGQQPTGYTVPAKPGRMTLGAWFDPTGTRILLGAGLTGPEGDPSLGALGTVLTVPGARTSELFLDGYQAHTEALGWSDEGPLVVSRAEDGREAGVVVDGQDGPRRIIRAEYDVPLSLTLATDLISLDHPTVTRPAPDWPWSDERKSLVIGTGVAVAIAALLGLRLLWRRRRRT